MMIFLLRKSWEFVADDMEQAREMVSHMNKHNARDTFQLPQFIETSEDLSVAEESLENHWQKYGE